MSMMDKRDKTSYIINNEIKTFLNDHGYMLSRHNTKSFDGQWLYNISKISLTGVQHIEKFTRNGLMDAYHKGVLLQRLNVSHNFKPAFILQKDVAILMSENGKPIHNYTINNYVRDGMLPEPIVSGRTKRWSVDQLCKHLKISEETLWKTLGRDY